MNMPLVIAARLFDLADDVLWSVADSLHGEILSPIKPVEASHSRWTNFLGRRT